MNIQEITLNIWPAKYFFFHNGWIIRVSEGTTKRANSVLPNFYYGENVQKDVLRVENIYKKFSLPPIFQIADYVNPSNLDEVLDEMGYRKDSKTYVLTSSTPILTQKIPDNNYTIEINSSLTENWLKTNQKFLKDTDKVIDDKKAILNRLLIPETNYFIIRQSDELLGVALGIMYETIMGIFEVVINPNHRRKNIATILMNYMFQFANNNDVELIFLQVVENNKPAMSLYKKLGLKKLFSYHYRIND